MAFTELPAHWRDRTVLVVGDAILDGWLAGGPRRLCGADPDPANPVPALAVERTTYACGGAAGVAVNVARLGGQAVLAAVVGEDRDGDRLRHRLRAAAVDARLVTMRSRRTLARRRLVGEGQALLCYEEGDTGHVPAAVSRRLAAVVADVLDRGVDAVLVADHGAGTVDQRVRDLIARRRRDIPLLVDDPPAPGAPREDGDGVVSLPELARRVAAHRELGDRIVFTNGCFDVLHRGHVDYLKQARRFGDVLVVAVNSDDSVRRLKGPDRPVNTAADRAAVLAGLSSVDYVVVFADDTPVDLVALVRPDIYVKGGDYEADAIPESPVVRGYGGEVRMLDFLPGRSTSKLIDRIRSNA